MEVLRRFTVIIITNIGATLNGFKQGIHYNLEHKTLVSRYLDDRIYNTFIKYNNVWNLWSLQSYISNKELEIYTIYWYGNGTLRSENIQNISQSKEICLEWNIKGKIEYMKYFNKNYPLFLVYGRGTKKI